jgi:hypothetical protein
MGGCLSKGKMLQKCAFLGQLRRHICISQIIIAENKLIPLRPVATLHISIGYKKDYFVHLKHDNV